LKKAYGKFTARKSWDQGRNTGSIKNRIALFLYTKFYKEVAKMKQRKIEVAIDGKIDVYGFDDVFFKTLLNRILELRRNKIAQTEKEN